MRTGYHQLLENIEAKDKSGKTHIFKEHHVINVIKINELIHFELCYTRNKVEPIYTMPNNTDNRRYLGFLASNEPELEYIGVGTIYEAKADTMCDQETFTANGDYKAYAPGEIIAGGLVEVLQTNQLYTRIKNSSNNTFSICTNQFKLCFRLGGTSNE